MPSDDGALDSDVDLSIAAQRAEVVPEFDLLAAAAVGGVLGALGRYALARWLAQPTDAWPWATFLTNLLGCALIGVLMAWLGSLPRPPRLARPFLGVGVLGGFTTFSTYATDAHELLLAHRPGVALGYLAGSALGCVAATALALGGTRQLLKSAR